MNKVFYWSPFNSKVATVKSVINSAESLNRFFENKKFKTYILDAVNEWVDFEEEIKKKKIENTTPKFLFEGSLGCTFFFINLI